MIWSLLDLEEQNVILFPLLLCSLVICTWWSDCRIVIFAHYTTSLSSSCRRIWKYCTSKILVMSTVSSVCLTLSQLSHSVMQYMGLCVFSLPLSLVMIVKVCVLHVIIIIKSQVWTICHCLGLGHETIICALCLSMYFSGQHRFDKNGPADWMAFKSGISQSLNRLPCYEYW